MRIIIDGYNVIKKFYHNKLISSDQRIRFLNELDAYSKKKDHDIIVVFDGGVLSYPEQFLHKSIQVVYAGGGQTADDYIIKYITGLKGELLLVSSDRQLCVVAAKNEIVSMDSLPFYNIMIDAVGSGKEKKHYQDGQVKKMASHEDVELDALMYEASLVIVPKSEDNEIVNEKFKKMSKLDKKLYSIIKKL